MKKIMVPLMALLSACSCSFGGSDKHEILIDQFRQNSFLFDTIHPIKGRAYTNHTIKLQGFVDDSVWVKIVPTGYKFYLSKKVDKKINSEYFGGETAHLVFCHYKATKGRLKITHSVSYYKKGD